MRRITILIVFLQFTVCGFSQTNDIELLRTIYHNRNASLDPTMKFISSTTTPLAMALPATLLITGYINRDIETWDDGITTVIALGSAVTFTTILKYTINRERPYERYPDIVPYARDFTPSFPSGHTNTAFVTATSLTLVHPKWYVIVPAYAYATVDAYSRLHMGMHYPSDILAGALIGSGCAIISHKLNKLLRPKVLYPKRFDK